MGTALRAARPHAIWTAPLPSESGAPGSRTVHLVRSPVDREGRRRVGFRPSLGYLKCGSHEETDWVRDARIWAWADDAWSQVAAVTDLPRPTTDATHWVDVDAPEATALSVELRRSWIDGWWPGWNLADFGVIIEPSPTMGPDVPSRGRLTQAGVSLEGLPDGLDGRQVGSTVSYASEKLQVALRLNAPSLASLVFDPDGITAERGDLLKHATVFDHTGNDLINNVHHPLRGVFANGPRLGMVDGIEPMGYLTSEYVGTSSVEGNVVRYRVEIPSAVLAYDIAWTVEPDAIGVEVTRTGERDLYAAESSAWQVPFASTAAPISPIARPLRTGETGLVESTGLLHAPGYGSLRYRTSGDLRLRVDSARPLMVVDLEVKVGERETELGTWELPAGEWSGAVRFDVTHGDVPPLVETAPAEARGAVRRAWVTGLAFRADTATLSNNGNSIHAPMCLDHWAELAVRVGPNDEARSTADLVIDTIERHLDGAPGYASGATSQHDERMEGEYLLTNVAVLHAVGQLLQARVGDRLLERAAQIRATIAAVAAQDLDDDGMIESAIRVGVPGDDVWGSNWWDLLGFGWKDAFVNGLLYGALRRLAGQASGLGLARPELAAWADRLRASYRAAFFDADAEWVAGWVDRDGARHDHAFLFVNGVAINEGLLDEVESRAVAERLLALLDETGPPDLRAGLPGNLRSIPDSEMAFPFPDMGYPFYENGGQTLSQARHFIGALYTVGLDDDADRLLIPMLSALADNTAFGGCASGLDWRLWDGTPCGYEGILTDQFGVVSSALRRWGVSG